MSNKKNEPAPGVRQVLVDIPTHDDEGKPITDDMLSSGGARDRGPMRKQYTNPRPYNPAPSKSAEVKAQRNAMIFDGIVWVWDEFGRDWWRARGPADLRRAGGWVKSQAQRLRKPATEPAPATEEQPPSAEAQTDVEVDTPLAPVTHIEEFRRSA